MAALTGNLLRRAGTGSRVTNIELFFDLVYVFAVTRESRYLVTTPTVTGGLRAALLLAMVWLVWVYTTWVTNWLDPERIATRLLLIGLMLASLVMSAGLGEAFNDRGLWIGVTYAVMQIGRSAFAVAGLSGDRLQRNFQRILAWCVVSGALAAWGGAAHGTVRTGLWVAAVVVDLLGGVVGFYTPGLGRSRTDDWTIEGAHFAERCQAFVLIALGESIIVIGGALADLHHASGTEVVASAAAFVTAVGFWWVYFDRSAGRAADEIAHSSDPGSLGRSAYHLVHPFMIAGIIVTAAGFELVLEHPTHAAGAPTAWMVLGGTALFVAGHAAFTAVVWRAVPWSRLAALAALAVLGLAGVVAAELSAVVLLVATAAIVVVLAASSRLRRDPHAELTLTGDEVEPDER